MSTDTSELDFPAAVLDRLSPSTSSLKTMLTRYDSRIDLIWRDVDLWNLGCDEFFGKLDHF
jgi:hypothetical protein